MSLKLDLVVDDCSDNLATNELPLRPWGIRLEKGSVHNDEVIEDLFYTWKNPVYEADYKQVLNEVETYFQQRPVSKTLFNCIHR